jgi:hypothetical protein
MAAPTTVPGSKFIVEIGDGATPTESFDVPCSITSKGVVFTGTPQENTVRDCDNPAAPTWIARTMSSLSAEFTGSGTLALEDFEIWRVWFEDALTKNIRIAMAVPAPDGGAWEGPAILSSMSYNSADNELVQIEVTILSAAPWLWNPA